MKFYVRQPMSIRNVSIFIHSIFCKGKHFIFTSAFTKKTLSGFNPLAYVSTHHLSIRLSVRIKSISVLMSGNPWT